MSGRCNRHYPGHMHQTEMQEFRAKLYRINPMCQICLTKIEEYEHASLDHKIPRSKGGKTMAENLQLAHTWCNGKKGNKLNYVHHRLRQAVTA